MTDNGFSFLTQTQQDVFILLGMATFAAAALIVAWGAFVATVHWVHKVQTKLDKRRIDREWRELSAREFDDCYCICHGNTDSRVLCGHCTDEEQRARLEHPSARRP